MVDQETGSQWSQLLGKAMKGPLKGEKLQVFPSTLTDWKTWRSKHPRTTVATLERTSGTYNRSLHQRDEYLLIGLADEHEARFWYFSALRKHHVINDSFAGCPSWSAMIHPVVRQ